MSSKEAAKRLNIQSPQIVNYYAKRFDMRPKKSVNRGGYFYDWSEFQIKKLKRIFKNYNPQPRPEGFGK